ncbi:MAG TPA: hypothetical protein PK366_04710, partial [Fibrobacteraceae bacterium]|nr:hypothetical protein [Fibrobacteraceae bacterium]
TISAESCKLTFAEDMKHIIFKLKNGEMHQSKISDLKDYRIIRFDDYKLITTAQGFGFEQSEEGVLIELLSGQGNLLWHMKNNALNHNWISIPIKQKGQLGPNFIRLSVGHYEKVVGVVLRP